LVVAIRKLAPEERDQALPSTRRQQDVSAYVEALRELGAGDVAAIGLQELPQRTVKRRFTLAARQLGYRISWSPQPAEHELFLRVEQVPVDGRARHGRTSVGCGTAGSGYPRSWFALQSPHWHARPGFEPGQPGRAAARCHALVAA
jgi:hypothetical protein